MIIAALPKHDHLNDPLWRTLFHSYRHVIAPLRYSGWIADLDTSSDHYYIRADLGDGTELVIDCGTSLPADPAKVTGWNVLRRNVEDPAQHTVVYESLLRGPQSHHATSLIPMFARIDTLDHARPMPRLIVSSTTTLTSGANHNETAGIELPGVALARSFDWAKRLVTEEAYQQVWERPEREGYPLALFERKGQITTIRVTPSTSATDRPRRAPRPAKGEDW